MQPVIASVTFLSFGNNFFDIVGFLLNEESKQAKSGLIKISLFHLQEFHKKITNYHRQSLGMVESGHCISQSLLPNSVNIFLETLYYGSNKPLVVYYLDVISQHCLPYSTAIIL